MRFLITAAPDPKRPRPDDAPPPDDRLIAAYMSYNEEMHRAGVLLAAEGLNPERRGASVGIVDGKRTLIDGPFAESKELVGGFYLIEVPSLDEAVAWALRSPVGLGTDDILTLHPMTDASDLPPHVLEIIESAAPTWSATFSRKPGG